MRARRIGFWTLVAVTMLLSIVAVATVVECSEDRVIEIKDSIQTLQPAVDGLRAFRLAANFVAAGEATEIDPKLLVAMAMRESSFDPQIETLERRGKIGEGGLMQIHGAALRLRPRHCDERLIGADCQIHTGARWLAWVRTHCGGSTSRWVAAYGMKQCPTEASARNHISVRIAKAYYDEIGGTQWLAMPQ